MKAIPLLIAGSAAAGVAIGGGYGFSPRAAVDPSCNIKGNISINSGERIYHVPGQKYYTETVIRPDFGERWFCSEADARAAGWRKSKS